MYVYKSNGDKVVCCTFVGEIINIYAKRARDDSKLGNMRGKNCARKKIM